MISLIAAVSENNVIGNKGKIPWHLPRDFKHFKETTMGHPIVMGRKTFESIGKPLPGRQNIILTRQKDFSVEGCSVIHSTSELPQIDDEIFIIGGAEIYSQFLSQADKIYLTKVHTEVTGDTLFPSLTAEQWQLVTSERHPKDEKNNFDITLETYERTGK